nr:PREDICTED: solute carrier family 2, facilitated glucose transporter member 5-like [Anolis carolinensis]|eukprot:XP_008122566.1 PREDICTED: solute carrier family 2, facilitated glucose transporter member 5-like [Anolis carolinensis]
MPEIDRGGRYSYSGFSALLIEDFYNTTYHLKNSVGIDKGFLTILYSLTLAMFSMGGLIGSLLFSPIVDKFGRKGALMLNNFLSMGSSVLMGLSATIRAYEYTIFSRMVNGICTGIFACAVPLYLAEVSPKNLRGGIMTVSRIFVVVGILCCQILALPELLGNINALQMLRCQLNVDQEIEELYQEDQAEKAEKVMSGMKIICYRGLRWQVVSVIILMSGQQLSGFSAMYIIDTVGRRLLILLGFGMCSILCVLLTMTLELQTTMSWMAYISASLVFVFFVGHVIGPGAVPQVIIAELFLQSSRSTAFSLGGFMYWLISLLTGVIFRQVESKIGSYSFLLFWPLCFGIFFYIFKIIPETKGKTFLDIRRLMNVHVNVARKIQVQGFGMDTKPTDAKAMDTKPTDTKAKGTKPIVKKLKKGRMGQKSGKKKKRKKSSTGEITK